MRVHREGQGRGKGGKTWKRMGAKWTKPQELLQHRDGFLAVRLKAAHLTQQTIMVFVHAGASESHGSLKCVLQNRQSWDVCTKKPWHPQMHCAQPKIMMRAHAGRPRKPWPQMQSASCQTLGCGAVHFGQQTMMRRVHAGCLRESWQP
eukprot:1161553-Pelagomonas_calceolata.AAC.1